MIFKIYPFKQNIFKGKIIKRRLQGFVALCVGILGLNSRVLMIAGEKQHVLFTKHTCGCLSLTAC